MEKSFKIAESIARQIRGTISESEKLELDAWRNESQENEASYRRSIDPKIQLEKLDHYKSFDKNRVWETLESKTETKVIPFFSTTALKYAASIMLPLLLGTLGYLYFSVEEPQTLANIDEHIKVGTDKAVLKLSNGLSITLGSDQDLKELQEGDSKVTIADNELTYTAEAVDEELKSDIYNELYVPKGGVYDLTLADGTKVWLNADSKLRFPASFSDSTRVVYLTGEAFFDVAHNGKPFIVDAGETHIRVLGTEFNVSAYDNESLQKTTLVEGKVRVSIEGSDIQAILSPDDQAVFGDSLVVNSVNTSQYVSWRQGKFEFANDDLETVMKRLARWYDFTYEFGNDDAKNYHFSARINNNEPISGILEMLQLTTDVKFEIKENTNTIVVL